MFLSPSPGERGTAEKTLHMVPPWGVFERNPRDRLAWSYFYRNFHIKKIKKWQTEKSIKIEKALAHTHTHTLSPRIILHFEQKALRL